MFGNGKFKILTTVLLALMSLGSPAYSAAGNDPLGGLDSIFQSALNEKVEQSDAKDVNTKFTVNPKVSDRVKGKMSDLLVSLSQTQQPDQIRQLVSQIDIINQLRPVFKQKGFNVDDVNTAIAAFFVTSYEIMNEVETTSKQDHAVWRQVRSVWGKTDLFNNLSNDDKQEMAESMYWQLLMLSVAYESAKKGEPGFSVAAIQSSVVQLMNRYNIDITQVTITDKGLVPKS